MSIHGRLSMPRLSVLKGFIADLEVAAVLALVPIVLCMLLFAEQILGR